MSKVKEEIENMIRETIDYVWDSEDKKVEAIITSLGAGAILSLFVHELIESVGISKENIPDHVSSAIRVTATQMIELEKVFSNAENQEMFLFSHITKNTIFNKLRINAI